MATVSIGGDSTGAYVIGIIHTLMPDQFYGEKVLADNIPWQICSLLTSHYSAFVVPHGASHVF